MDLADKGRTEKLRFDMSKEINLVRSATWPERIPVTWKPRSIVGQSEACPPLRVISIDRTGFCPFISYAEAKCPNRHDKQGAASPPRHNRPCIARRMPPSL